MTVRLAQDMGMPLVAEYAKRFGIYDNMLPVLSMSLGRRRNHASADDGTAYATIANGGRKAAADADRQDPGPLRPDNLQARQPHL
jgi:penicillin-binding protein 1A